MEHAVELVECVTPDHLIHQGFVFDPPERKGIALLWVHGLTGTFYGGLKIHDAMCAECAKRGFGYAAFNNRGHDAVSGIRKYDPDSPKGYSHVMGGAGYEHFSESVMDIDGGIDFLIRRGYRKVVVVGHSTGANKACYYGSVRMDNPHVSAIVLGSPMSDRIAASAVTGLKGKWLELLVKIGRGEKLMDTRDVFFPLTPKRELSLLSPKSTEDVFDYGDGGTEILRTFGSVRYPLLVVLGESDEHAFGKARDIRAAFDGHAHARMYRSILVEGADHGYTGKEKEFARGVCGFVGELSR